MLFKVTDLQYFQYVARFERAVEKCCTFLEISRLEPSYEIIRKHFNNTTREKVFYNARLLFKQKFYKLKG